MAFSDELFFAPASQLLQMLRSRQVSSAEMVSAFIERIESLNHHVKSVVTLVEERAAEESDEADRRLAGREDVRPLEGLPITIKDSIETEGIRSTDGMKILEHHVPTEDAPTVARLRAAGAIIIAKTNLPEMAMDYDCDNPLFGATNNPWHIGRVPGGSSGGEAASLASGMCALGLGSDYGGSIRIPSHFCGMVGLKPTWGTIPGTGHLPPSPAAPPPIAHMATIGPMARYVDDLTLEYNILRGPHSSTPYTVPSTGSASGEGEPQTDRMRVFHRCRIRTYRWRLKSAPPSSARPLALSKIGVPVEQKTPPIKEAARIWIDYAMADGGELLREMLAGREHLSRERLRTRLMTPLTIEVGGGIFPHRNRARHLPHSARAVHGTLSDRHRSAILHHRVRARVDRRRYRRQQLQPLRRELAGAMGQLRGTSRGGRAGGTGSRRTSDRRADRRARVARKPCWRSPRRWNRNWAASRSLRFRADRLSMIGAIRNLASSLGA